jgi:hypothetical protein
MIIKIEKRADPYARIDNKTINDRRLSLKARGLLVYLLSKPPRWHVVFEVLVSEFPDGRYAIRTALNELQKYGYAKLVRPRNDRGRITGSVWMIYERPTTEMPVFPLSVKSDSRKNPVTGEVRLPEKSAPINDIDICTNKRERIKGLTADDKAMGNSSAREQRAEDLSFSFVEESESLSPVENKLRKEFDEWCDSVGGKPTEKGFQTWKKSQAEKDKGYLLNNKFFTTKKANELALKDHSLLDKFKPAIRRGNKIELVQL